jgi:hypothetical protein
VSWLCQTHRSAEIESGAMRVASLQAH